MTNPGTLDVKEATIDERGGNVAPPSQVPGPAQAITAQRTARPAPSHQRRRRGTQKTIPVGTLPDDRLRLQEPLLVRLAREGEFYLAENKDLEEFGYGHDPMGAVDDLRLAIVELYWTLKDEQDRLGDNLKQVWFLLQQVVQER